MTCCFCDKVLDGPEELANQGRDNTPGKNIVCGAHEVFSGVYQFHTVRAVLEKRPDITTVEEFYRVWEDLRKSKDFKF